MTDNKLPVPYDDKSFALSNDVAWQEIADQITAELSDMDAPDKVIRATELLLAGFPTFKAAKILGVRTETIRKWLTTYPTMAKVVSQGRQLLSKWRMAKLEQQFLTAVERSEEILEVGLSDETVNPKILGIVAQHSRYVIGLFAGQKLDVTVTHELGKSVLKAQDTALDYIAQALAAQRENADEEPIEAIYRVVDAKFDSEGPLLTETGDPPYGKMGVLDTTEEGILCHICGSRVRYLSNHLQNAHNFSTTDYERQYMLLEGAVRHKESEWQK